MCVSIVFFLNISIHFFLYISLYIYIYTCVLCVSFVCVKLCRGPTNSQEVGRFTKNQKPKEQKDGNIISCINIDSLWCTTFSWRLRLFPSLVNREGEPRVHTLPSENTTLLTYIFLRKWKITTDHFLPLTQLHFKDSFWGERRGLGEEIPGFSGCKRSNLWSFAEQWKSAPCLLLVGKSWARMFQNYRKN